MPLKIHQDEPPTLNLTSMIDVVFLLLIFFMVGTKFSEMEQNMALDLPKVSGAPIQGSLQSNKTVNLFRDGTISIDNRRMSLSEVTRALGEIRRQTPEMAVTVRSDEDVSVRRFAEVMAAIKQSGVERIGMGVGQSTMAR